MSNRLKSSVSVVAIIMSIPINHAPSSKADLDAIALIISQSRSHVETSV
ncbi:MAG: hypothetical protein RIG66_33700 [Coleofasciculus sp. E2-BRE-01]